MNLQYWVSELAHVMNRKAASTVISLLNVVHMVQYISPGGTFDSKLALLAEVAIASVSENA